MRNVAPLLALLSLGITPAAAQESLETGAAAQDPLPALFADHTPLTLTIEADFHQLRRDRDDENEERPGHVTVHGGSGAILPVDIRTRGRFRLQSRNCEFPPLRLDFPKSALEGTVFDGQDKLKLVTHCRDRDSYEQNTLEEFLVYRMFNVLTDRSFRVRLARITYVDTAEEEDTVERWGFLIESEEGLAERLGGEIMDDELVQQVHPARLLGRNTGLVSVFQFMVGNTDWSMSAFHNFVLVQTPEEIVPVPYDFDWTGFVDAPYAKPDPSLGTRTVRQRVYREFCRVDIDYPALFEAFRAHRPDLESLVRTQVGLEEDEKEDALEYLADFYEIIDDPRKAQREIIEACRTG